MAQDDILSTKGCKRDPYTLEEYGMIPTNEWQGGWVRNASTDSIQYYNSNGQVQQTILKGQSANPYTESEYINKIYNENWPGGWVVYLNLSIRHIDAFNQSGDLIALGKQQNPYYYVEFNNLYVTNDWHGGWVEYESGGKAYINAQGQESDDPEASGSGSGDGSGSGSGSGSNSCDVIAGSDFTGVIVYQNGKPYHYRISVSWTAGSAMPGGTSSISGTIVGYLHNGIYHESSGTANCEWVRPFTATITYNGSSTDFGIPELYHGV